MVIAKLFYLVILEKKRANIWILQALLEVIYENIILDMFFCILVYYLCIDTVMVVILLAKIQASSSSEIKGLVHTG